LRVVKIFWKREIQAICGLESADKIQILSAGDEATPLQPDAQWIICHYALLHSRLAELKKFPFRTLIVDEGHLAKAGEKSQRGAAIMKLGEDRPNVCYLTGSPSPNGRPIELLPMLKVLRKVHAREEWRWKLKFCGAEQVVINQKGVKLYGRAPIKRWSFKGASHLDELALSLSTFSLERTKAEVFGDLPPIQHTVFDIELQPDDREKYFSMREEMEKLLRTDDPKLRGRALGLLTTMIAFSAQAKTADASDVCRERINSGLKTLVICDYLSPLGALRRELRDVSEIIEGSMKDAYRQVVIDRFQNEAQPQVLLLSRRTAGQSVTLTAADCLLWLNLPWTPGEYAQGCGRIERLGQTRSTQSIVLVCADTYDEELIQLNYRKAGFIEMAAGRVPLPPARVSSFAQMLKMLGGSSRVKPDLN
jgi:hypothetical protein